MRRWRLGLAGTLFYCVRMTEADSMSLEDIRDSDVALLSAADAARGLACSACACACVLAVGEVLGGGAWDVALASYVASVSAFIVGAAYGALCDAAVNGGDTDNRTQQR